MSDDMNQEIYLDHAATTPLDSAAAEAMSRCWHPREPFGNPNALHPAGRRASASIETARERCAALIGAPAATLVFTSGATEADNLAIVGGARFRAHRGRHLVTMATEHKAVLGAMAALEREGFEVTRLAPAPDGVLDLDTLIDALRADTQLVSVMAVNNETGVRQPIEAIGAACRARDILFHTDAAQAVGKLPIDVDRAQIDMLSMSAHKMHGPAGVGALYVRDAQGCGIAPLMHGGGQEQSLRPGSLPLALIVGFGVAAQRAAARRAKGLEHLEALQHRFWELIQDLPGVRRNGSSSQHSPAILNVSVSGLDGESLLLALEPLNVAGGAACNSQGREPSFVLRALGLSDREAQSAIRFSFSWDTTFDEVEFAATHYRAAVTRLRELAPPSGL